jgi:indole-3-glycerol phosphate synthase
VTRPEGVLDRIVARTRESVLVKSRERPLESLLAEGGAHQGVRSLSQALSRAGGVNVIAEFKRRSPSRGLLRDDLDPVQVAQAYEVAGAAALSILTEEQFFGGSIEDLRQARAATLLPTLRKDFVIDPYQVWEAWHAGADAVLLIVAALSDAELQALLRETERAGIEALVEVHDEDDLTRALHAGARLVGVNNRNLRTMEVSLRTALQLAPLIPDDVVAVAESGLRTGDDVRSLRNAGYDAFLIGEHFMLADEPGAALARLLRESEGDGHGRSARTLVKVCGITHVDDAPAAARSASRPPARSPRRCRRSCSASASSSTRRRSASTPSRTPPGST